MDGWPGRIIRERERFAWHFFYQSVSVGRLMRWVTSPGGLTDYWQLLDGWNYMESLSPSRTQNIYLDS
jgi:hypothetical protein